MNTKYLSLEGHGSKILVVDDEPEIVQLISIHLQRRGYKTLTASNAYQALELAEFEQPDVIILDINMPGMDGITSIPELRKITPAYIIMLSSNDFSQTKVEALDHGADDYMVKPFDMEELIAHIRVALRHNLAVQRNAFRNESLIISDNYLMIDLSKRTVTRENLPVRLSNLEFNLIEILASNLNKTLSRREVLQKVWGASYGNESDILRTLIKQVRRKIEPNPSKPRYLITEGRIGYRFTLSEPK